jgi:hypothetical protein
MSTGTSRVERFLAHLDTLTGSIEPEFWRVSSTAPDLPSVTAIGYQDLPEPGMFLGLTYGLSAAAHTRWLRAKPELAICVRSDDPAWVLAVASLAEQLRGDCPFQYGDLLDFRGPIATDTAMDGFVVFSPAMVDPDDAEIEVGDDLPVCLVGVYPTYASERDFIRENGLEAFWQLDWDLYDVGRPPAVG